MVYMTEHLEDVIDISVHYLDPVFVMFSRGRRSVGLRCLDLAQSALTVRENTPSINVRCDNFL